MCLLSTHFCLHNVYAHIENKICIATPCMMLHAGLTWDASSQYILSMMFTGQICIWGIPTSTTPQTSSAAVAQPHAMQLQFISASSIAQIAAMAHPYALPHISENRSAQTPHTALLQQRVQGSCQLWVPLADHDILTVT